jgi:hypothetical protein
MALLFYSPNADTPDGHLKIPHLWPGQNPSPEVRSYPLATEQNMQENGVAGKRCRTLNSE